MGIGSYENSGDPSTCPLVVHGLHIVEVLHQVHRVAVVGVVQRVQPGEHLADQGVPEAEGLSRKFGVLVRKIVKNVPNFDQTLKSRVHGQRPAGLKS